MCGRMSLFTPQPVVEERFDAAAAAPLEPRYNVAPRDDVAAIRNDAPDTIDRLRWGLVPRWADDPDGGHVNARAETVAEKPSFREAFERRRCLVLADGFYEWREQRGGTQPYRVARADGEPFAMAGLWERWTGDDGRSLATATVITTEPNEVVAPLHDRMAVVLAPEEERRWLHADDPEERRSLLDPAPAEEFTAHPVSTAVNDPTSDGPRLVEPVEPAEQSGLDDFA